MKRLDDLEEETYVKACIYGPPGTGKTSFGVTAPKPLIALTERQGIVHVKQAVKRLGCPMPQVLFIESANDLRNLVRALHGDRSQPFRIHEVHEADDGNGAKKPERLLVYENAEWPETIVLDSATDACRLLVEEIRRQSPPTKGRDGLPTDSQRFWNVLLQRAQSMILTIRDLPMHAIFMALADDREKGDEENKVRSVQPMMAAKQLAITLSAAVNVVGYSYRRTHASAGGREREIVYGIMTTGPEYMTTKPYRPLRDNEVTDFAYWVRVINGQSSDRPAPPPSQEVGGGDVGAADKPLTEASEAAPETNEAEPASEAEEPKKEKPVKSKRRAG